MLQNSSHKPEGAQPAHLVSLEPKPLQPIEPKAPRGPWYTSRRLWMTIGLPIWVFLGFMLSQALLIAIIEITKALGISYVGLGEAAFSTIVGAAIYALTLLIVVGVPWLVKKSRTTKTEIGLQRAPSWFDIGIAPVAFITYLIISAAVMAVAMSTLTFIDFQQAQDTGFTQISAQYETILAFLTLVVIAPIAEEIVFRGYLLGKLRKYAPLWISILITSLLFALVHFAWNVGIDVFVLSIVLCLLRVWSKSLWAPILVHMIKNGVAFYFLFINPSFLSTLGG